MSRSILAIDGNVSHDSSVTVIHNGEIYAVESERLDRVKKSPGHDFTVKHTPEGPVYTVTGEGVFTQAIAYCMQLAGITHVDHIIHTQAQKFVRHLKLGRYLAPGGTIKRFPSHHLAHACSAFYFSDFAESAVLVVDGSGPEHGSPFNILQSMYYFDGTQIKAIKRTFATQEHQVGIGLNYYLHTHLMGMEEGSIMGLSSYGDHSKYTKNMLYRVDGHTYLNPANLPHPISTSTAEARQDSLHNHYGISGQGPVDAARKDVEHSFLADVAAKLQHETEERMIELALELHKVTGAKNLCLAGGVTLNSVANNKILERTPFENVFIQPAAHDAGITLGLALFAHHHQHGEPRRRRRNVFLGKAYTNAEIQQTLTRYDAYITVEAHDDVYPVAAQLLADEEVLAWFQGRLEFGPRALGHRSILGHPGSIAVRDRVNDIKRRQRWRPLAPAVLDTHLDAYFQMLNHNAYMLLVASVTDLTRQVAPAVVHVDGTARPQSVNCDDNPVFHRIIYLFHEKSGVPILINTSLNSKGEPLIENPEQAVLFLLNSGVDALVIGDFVVRRKPDCPTGNQVSVRVNRVEETWNSIDCDACVVSLNQKLSQLHVKSLGFFRGSYNVVIQVTTGTQERTLDLGLEVLKGGVTQIINNRSGAVMSEKFLPLVGPFVIAFEQFLNTSTPDKP